MSLPVFVSVFVLVCICLSVSFSVIAKALTLLEDRQAGEARLAVRVKGGVGWWLWGRAGGRGARAGAASQPLPSGDPDVRPWLLLDHCLYFVIDLFKAVPFHDSCSRTQDVWEEKQRGMEGKKWHRRWWGKRRKKKHLNHWGGKHKESQRKRGCLSLGRIIYSEHYSILAQCSLTYVRFANCMSVYFLCSNIRLSSLNAHFC